MRCLVRTTADCVTAAPISMREWMTSFLETKENDRPRQVLAGPLPCRRCDPPRRSQAQQMMNARLLAALALLILGVVACGGTTSPTASTGSPTIGIAGGRLGTAAVIISATDQNRFDPVVQHATVGEIIEWSNLGLVTHNLVFRDDASIGDPVLAGGGVWQVRFTNAGTYQYACTLHDGMVGTIVVSPE
jgi:plastocyanin